MPRSIYKTFKTLRKNFTECNLISLLKPRRCRRYALLLAARDSDYVKKVYGGYINVFKSAFAEKGERWDLFRVVDGEFPEMAKLDKYHGFVVSGSPYDAYGDDYWILKLCSLLRILYAKEKKVLGVCFGHQVLCRALGGKVRKSSTGWDIGVRGVSIVKDCFLDDVMEVDGFEGQASVEIPKSLAIIECHQDEVSEVPAGAEIISVSEKTGVEMFTFDGHVMGIQGHPEYTKDILCNLIDRLLNNGCIERDFAEDAKSTLKVSEPNRKCWERICRNFLKGRLHTPAL